MSTPDPDGPDGCAHDAALTAEVEGWEQPGEPLQVRVTCPDCDRYLQLSVNDPELIEWQQD